MYDLTTRRSEKSRLLLSSAYLLTIFQTQPADLCKKPLSTPGQIFSLGEISSLGEIPSLGEIFSLSEIHTPGEISLFVGIYNRIISENVQSTNITDIGHRLTG